MAHDLPSPEAPAPAALSSDGPPSSGSRRLRLAAGLTVGLGLAVLGGLVASNRLSAPPAERIAEVSTEVSTEPSESLADSAQGVAEAETEAALPAPNEPELRAETQAAEPEVDTQERWKSALIETAPVAAPQLQTGIEEREPDASSEIQTPAALVQTIPIPMPRPADLRAPVLRRALRQAPSRISAAPAAPIEDTRSFFDKLFGVERPNTPPAPALAYASLESTGSVGSPPALPRAVPPPVAPAPAPQAGGGTAIYDITARVVTLPSGEKLEAHSGLGSVMDDPRFVHLRMRGPTPPGTYDLTEREDVFHGVRAIRMTPVGGSAAIHGRDGILAHTYMLGPSGQSNGCVAFREYDKFLQAYLRGEVSRLVVVAGGPRDALPSLVKRIFGTERTTKVGSAE